MGAWVTASVLLKLVLLVSVRSLPLESNPAKRETVPLDGQLAENNPVSSLAQPNKLIKTSSTNLLPYSVVPYPNQQAAPTYIYPGSYQPVEEASEYGGGIAKEFSSIEDDKGSYNDNDFHDRDQFLDTTGYNEYGSQTSFNLVGPKQLEEIETKNYHKEVEPYDTHDYKIHHHKEGEEHAEVHYHQHKHLHKHKHKQEHKHKHKEEHKHEHDHKHHHDAHHEHKHKEEHKHHEHNEHKHEHHAHHEHQHKQEHKHDHHHGHKHEHQHKEEHKHEQHHKHKHEEWSEHKHKHYDDHKHDHHHGHKHWNEHKHEHKHHNHHQHKHGHKHDHKHHHHEKNHHSHYKHQW